MKRILFLLCAALSLEAHAQTTTTLVPLQSVWKYLDNGTNQGTAWQATGFNDSTWAQGAAELGYGDGGEATVVGYGPNSGAKYITTYFRKSFAVTGAGAYTTANLRIRRDDGVVIYLNGTEIYRTNLPAGIITHTTLASAAIGGADESTLLTSAVNAALLTEGTNVLAVEMHQNAGSSSDLSFDMDLTATAPPAGIPVANAQVVTLNEDTTTGITLTGSDPENASLTYSIVTAPAKGTLTGVPPAVTYTPNVNTNGADSFTFKVNDGTNNSPAATVSLTVTAVNDAPAANSQSVTAANGDPVTVTLNGSDVESHYGMLADYTQQFYSGDLTAITDGLSGATWNANTETLFLVRNVSAGAGHSYEYNADGTWLRTIAQSGFQDTEAIAWMYGGTYAIAEENNFQRITICTIAPGATTLDRTAAGNVTWNTVVGSLLNLGIESMCYDAGRNLLYYLAEKPAGGTWNIYTMDPATGVSSVLCDLNASVGIAAVATDISDMAFDRATDTILLLSHESSKIIRVSRAGVVLEQRGFTTAFTQAEALALTPDRGRLFVGGEPKQFARYALPADTLTYSLVTPPAHGTLSGLPPTVIYTPEAGYEGPDSFTFTLSDGVLTSAPATVTVTVPAFNVPPAADNQSLFLDEDTSAAVVLSASDPENAPLTWSVQASPAHGALTGTAPNLTYTPEANYFGADSFTFRVNDGGRNSNTATVTLSVISVQDAPIALPGTGNIEASYPLPLTLAGTDADGQALTYAIEISPAHGTLTGVPPSVTYTAPVEYAGPDSFTFTVSDGLATSAAATVNIVVAPFNLPPVAQNGSLTTDEDIAAAVTLSASDPESSPLTYAITVPPAKGTLSGTAPNLTYTPLGNANGSDSFTWTASDGGKTSAPAAVGITITPVNDAPVAQSLSIPVERDTPGVVTLLGSDAENSPLTFTVLTQPVHGTLGGTAPALTFAPGVSYTGADTFSYKVNDGSLDSPVATVSLTVSAPSMDTLVAAGSTWKYLDNGTNQGTAWRASGFDDSAWLSGPSQLGYGDGDEAKVIGYGPDVNNRYVTSYFRREFQLPNPNIITAALKLDIVRDDGAIVYLNGSEILRSNMPTGTIAYNTLASSNISAPAESTFYTSALSPSLLLPGRNVLAVEVHQGALNSADVSFDFKLYESQAAITRGPYVQMTGADRATVRWRTDVATTSKLDYGLSAAALTSSSFSATLKTEHEITVTGLAPNTRFYYGAGNSSGVLASGASNYFTTHPPVGTVQPYRFWVLGDPGTGTANQTAVRDAFYTWNGAQQLAGVLVLGDTVYDTGTDLEFQTKFFDFYPTLMRNTTVWPTFGNHDAGSASSATQSGPYYDSFTMPKYGEAGGVASGTEAYYSFDIGNIHFVCLDSQGTSLLSTGNMAAWLQQDLSTTTQEWIVAFWHHPSYSKGGHDSDVATADGGRMKDMREVFVPILENHGVDLVLFGHEHNYQRSKFMDGHYGVSATFNAATMVKQTGLGNPAVDGAYTKGDGPHKGAVYTVAGSSGQVTVATLNHAAMAVSYTELGSVVLDVNGRELVARFLNSTGAIRDTFSIVHNTAPVAAAATVTGNEDAPLAVTLAATDAENDALSWEIVTPPAIGTLSGTAPNLNFTPPVNFNGTVNLQFRVNDGRVNSTTATVTLNIAPVNDVPIGITQSVTVAEDSLAVITLTGADAEGDLLTFSVTSLPAHGSLAGVLPAVTFIPDADWNGEDSFAFTVSDGSAVSAPAVVSLTLTPVNDAPVAADVTVTADEDSAAAVVLSAADIEGDALVLAVVTQPAHGTLSGTVPNLTYTPEANWHGQDAFTFVANDGGADSVPGIVSIIVTPVNDAPVASGQSVAIAEDTPAGITLAATDADGDVLVYAVTVPPGHGTLSGAAPELTYTPAPDWNGTDSFAFTVSDGMASSASAVVAMVVTPVNDVPLAAAQSLITDEDTALPLTLTGSDADAEVLTFAIAATPVHGALSGTGPDLIYTPDAGWNGADSFSFTVSDGTGASVPAAVNVVVAAVNDAPLAAAQTVATDEDAAAGITLVGTDADGDALTFTILVPAAHGTFSGIAPNLIYTPDANWNGEDGFTFSVSDGVLSSEIAAVAVSVSPVNDVPVAADLALIAAEDTAQPVILSAADVDGDSLTWQITLLPSHGTLSGTAPALTYTPDPDWNGGDSFSYTASDALAASAPSTVSLTITAVNDAPVAVAQAVTAAEDTAQALTLTGTDTEGTALTYTVTAPPAHGTLAGVLPELSYTPEADWNGSDSFAFTVSDGTDTSAPAVVSITVTPVNDAPLAAALSVTTNEDTAAAVSLAATDVEGGTLTYTVLTPPAHGTLSGTAPDFIYTPEADWNGSDSFAFTVSDGTDTSAPAVVSITVTPVNDAPLAAAQAVTAAEDTAQALTLTGTDVDGDALTFTVTALPAHGVLAGVLPGLIYTPDANWNGTDSFEFTVSDGTATSASAAVAITVTPVNDVPLAAAQTMATDEDAGLSITLAGSDVDGDALTFTVTVLPAHGTLSGSAPDLIYTPEANWNGADAFTYAVSDALSVSAPATVSLTVTAVNDAPVAVAQTLSTDEDNPLVLLLTGTDLDGDVLAYTVTASPVHGTLAGVLPEVTYIPDHDWNGTDSFSFTVNDGSVISDPAPVAIIVTAVNDPPLAAAQSLVTDEDATIPSTLAGSDADADVLTYSVLSLPAHGVLGGVAPNLTYTPQTNWHGEDGFTFIVSDGAEISAPVVVGVSVVAVNDSPVASALEVSTGEDTAIAFTLSAVDVDGDVLTYAVTVPPAHGFLSGTAPDLSYMPAANWNGTVSMEFTVSDGTGASAPAIVSITVAPGNDVPVAMGQSLVTNEEIPLPVMLAGTDLDEDTLTFTVVVPPEHGSLSGTAPALTYTPEANWNGADSFDFTVSDAEGASIPATVSITVAPVNDAPLVIAQSTAISEDTPAGITLAASDADGDTLVYSVTVPPLHGTLSGTAPDLTYSPETNWNGTDSFEFTVSDGTATSAPAAVSITVSPVNDAPAASAQAITTSEDTPIALNLAGTDSDGDILTYAITMPPQHGALSGTLPDVTYTPDPDWNGDDSFAFTASDVEGASLPATVSVAVTPVNDVPVAVAQAITTAEDTLLPLTLSATDEEGETLTFSITVPPVHGTLSGTPPSLTYTPDLNWHGIDTYFFTAGDGSSVSAAAAVLITVTAVNDAPLAVSQSLACDEDVPLSVTLTGSDVDGDVLSFAVTVPPVHGSLSGTVPDLIYTPGVDFHGTDSFSFTATDGSAVPTETVIALTVSSVNDLPIASASVVITGEDAAVAAPLAATDADGDDLTFTVLTAPAHGALSGAAPALIYTPAANWHGSDQFTWMVNDGAADSLPVAAVITVTPVNDAPAAAPVTLATVEDSSVNITLAGSDADGDPLAYSIVSPPAHGTLTGTAQEFSYAPDADYHGADSFTYAVNDGQSDSAAAVVDISITAVNDTPVAVAQSLSGAEDSIVSVVLTGTDVEGSALTFAFTALPTHGMLTGVLPEVTYIPDADWNGVDSFAFTVSDGTETSAPATVVVTVTPVNDAPAAASHGVTTTEDTAADVTLTATDVEGDTLTFIIVTPPGHGTLSGAAPDLIYTPETNWHGEDAFTFVANDGQTDSVPGIATITVAPVNDTPVASGQFVVTSEDTPAAITLAAIDADDDGLVYNVSVPPAHGTLSGTAPDLSYTPDADWNGSDNFEFTVSDGTATSVPAAVAITVTPVNDAPVASSATITTEEDTAAVVQLTAADVEGDALTYTIATPPAHGTLSGTAPDLLYTPEANWNGGDFFTFTASDVTGVSLPMSVLMSVTAVNDVPVAAPQILSTAEDNPLDLTLSGSDIDSDGLVYTITSLPVNGTLAGLLPGVTYIPNHDWNGTDSFAFTVNDGVVSSSAAVVAIAVTSVNDLPVPSQVNVTTGEDTAAAVILTATDIEGDLLAFTIAAAPEHGLLSGTAPDLVYTPQADWHGEDSFSFFASDAQGSSIPGIATITVVAVNDLPVAEPQNLVVVEDSALPVTLAGIDSDGDSLTFTVTLSPAHGSLSGTAPNLIYTPAANWHGADVFRFTVSDGTVTSVPAEVSLTVTPVNDSPIAAAQSLTMEEDSFLPIILEGFDADADALTFIITLPPAHGTLNGTLPNLTYTPESNWNGTDSFSFITSDGVANSSPTITAITVTPVNDLPVAVAQIISTAEDSPLALTLTGTDIDGDALEFTVTALPSYGTLSGSTENRTYTPAANWSGSDGFSFTVSDGTAISSPRSVSITVTPVNDVPVAAALNVTTDVGVPVAVILTGSDEEGSTLTWNITVQPAFGILSGSGAARTYSPNLAWRGTDQFAFTVSDGTATSLVTTAMITVASSGAWQLVARAGHPAPGTGGATFSIFQPDYVSDAAGRASFRGTAGAITGIWTEGASGLEAVVTQAAAAPGVASAVFDSLTTGPWAAGDGELLVFGKLLPGTGGVTNSNDLGYWRRGGGVTSLIAREDGVVPGMAAAARYSVLSAVATFEAGGNYAYAATMKTNSSLGITSANDTGVWATFGTPARLLVRESNVAPGSTDGGLFDTLTTAGLVSNGAGQIGFASALKITGTIATANRYGLWMWDPAQFGLVARGANASPGTSAGAVFAQPLNPAFGDGAMTFRSTLTAGAGGVITSNDTGLWILEGGLVSLLAREGFQAPGVPAGGIFNGFTEGASLNSGNEFAFRAALRSGSGVTSANNAGLWVRSRFTANVLSLVARKGATAPGAATATFASFDYPFVADHGGEVFTAALTVSTATGVTPSNDRGLWVRAATGSLALGLREGTSFTLAPGDVRTVANITLPATRSSGRSPLSEDSRLLVLLSFTDGSTALYHYTLP